MRAIRRERGSVLVTVLILASIMAVFCMTSLILSTSEVKGTGLDIRRDQALFAASSGIEDEIAQLQQALTTCAAKNPVTTFQGLVGKQVIARRTVASGLRTVAEYDVWVDSVTETGGTCDITLRSVGYVPSADHPQVVTRMVTAVVRTTFTRSSVFDYVYFINNWGWFHGDTITANGNIGANGPFDFGGYKPHLNSICRFETLPDGSLGEMIDRGGCFAGWNITGADRVSGIASRDEFMHPFQPNVPMPNLTDLTFYEGLATSGGSSISIGGRVVCDGVTGDGRGEPSNLYLAGTSKDPIVLNGPVVVRGDLIIKGQVTGKGAIYCSGNIYVAGNIVYQKGIQPINHAANKQAVENWIDKHQSADALGLYSSRNIVVGDFTDSNWQRYVLPWVYDSRNRSDEDVGEDFIPNTRAGRDGQLGTADDDVLENDGEWTVQRYTAEMEAAGMLPEGARVGDPIPGTGEDVDGDGQYDRGVHLSDFYFNTALDSKYWAGNMPAGFNSYSKLCDSPDTINRLDGIFYTNHTFALLTLDRKKDLNINGTLVSRNEAIVYSAKKFNLNYDLRLLNGSGLRDDAQPRVWQPISIVMWTSN